MLKNFGYRVLERNGKFAIYEVFYDENGEPETCTANPLSPAVLSKDGLLHELKAMQDATELPILSYDGLSPVP